MRMSGFTDDIPAHAFKKGVQKFDKASNFSCAGLDTNL
jgi:hypothetical protein